MKATITTTGETVTGKNIQAIRNQLNARLSVDGPQGLTAVTETGTQIHVELFEGQDYVLPAAAALGSLRSDRKSASSAENGKKGGRPRRQ